MKLYNSIKIDGSLFVVHKGRIRWNYYMPEWFITAYCYLFGGTK